MGRSRASSKKISAPEEVCIIDGDSWDDGSQELLCYFVHRFLDFRHAEVEACAARVGCDRDQLQWRQAEGASHLSPFWYLKGLSYKEARAVSRRSLLLRGFLEVWGEGSDWSQLEQSIAECPDHIKQPYLGKDVSFKVQVDCWGFKMTMDEQIEAIEKLHYLPFEGPVNLREPREVFWLILTDSNRNQGMPEVPTKIVFARQVAVSDRSLLQGYKLSNRLYLGPTSMDAEMALIMCNMAKVGPGALVFDPYVGTGSILVAAAHYGALTLGGDIDIKVIRDGKVDEAGQPLDIYSNFKQYQLAQPVGLLRMDAHRSPFREDLEEVVDAIIGDPPYGVRAGARKTVAKDLEVRYPDTHIPSTDPYYLGEVLRDLLDMAAKLLTVGGRLVYFLPATPETYKEEEVPQHPALQIINNCEQPLTTRYSRRLITMEKVRPYDAQAAAAHHAAIGEPIMAIDMIHESVYERFEDDQGRRVAPPEAILSKQRYRGKVC